MTRLRLDHARLSRVLREIEVQRARLRSHPEAAQPVLVDAVQYLLDYQNSYHHPREDRLYERLAAIRAELRSELKGLNVEHRSGTRHTEQLSATLRRISPAALKGSAGEKLARQLQKFVDQSREHMRHEERAVFYAGVEPMLPDDEWSSLVGEDIPDDPMGDAANLARRYPNLAAVLSETVRGLSAGSKALAADAPRNAREQSIEAARESMEALLEGYGELLHEGIALLRANAASLLMAGSPFAAARAVPAVVRRSCQFATRCVTQPSRLTMDAAARVFAPLLPARQAPARAESPVRAPARR